MSSIASGAVLALDELFTDNMVLQRNDNVAVFGVADAGDTITVTFAGQSKVATTDVNGKWSVALSPMAASFSSRTLTASTATGSVSISNVLVGDVWLASGQSNMDHPFSSYSQLSSSGKDSSSIRLLKGALVTSTTPQETATLHASHGGSWRECTSAYLESFSPVAYFCGAKLQADLSIPIGLIESAYGGTRAEAWTPASKLQELGYPELDPGEIDSQDYSVLYNAMIHPFKDFTFKGVIWYQGESNHMRAMEYGDLFTGMIESWREAFGRGDIPFYFVQLAPFNMNSPILDGASWAFLREAQVQALSLPNTGMVVTTDLGEYDDIHPQNKQPVGERLALHALKAEGQNLISDSPIYSAMVKNENEITISFSNADTGLQTAEVRMNKNANLPIGADTEAYVVPASSVAGFTICGSDKVFVAADAVISGNQIIVSSASVPDPVAVRYAWADFPLCNLYSMEGLPVSPFRTDSFLPLYDDAEFVSLHAPDSVQPGQTFNASVTYRNTGTSTWSEDDWYRLGSENPQSNTTWLGTTRDPMDAGTSAAPGETYTWVLSCTAPAELGDHDFQWDMVQERVKWFGKLSTNKTITVSNAAPSTYDDADFVSHDASSSVEPGKAFNVDITFLNTGTTSWSAADGFQLAAIDSLDNTTWISERVDMDASIVAPGESYTFTVPCTAPMTLGAHSFYFRMIDSDGVGAFGAKSAGVTVINVAEINNATYVSDTTPAEVEPGASFDVSVTYLNSGSTTWTEATLHKLGLLDGANNISNPSRIHLDLAPVSVAPGESYTFEKTLTAPGVEGDYVIQYQMVEELVEWFGEQSPLRNVTVITRVNDATYISDDAPTEVAAGSNFNVSVTYRNDGNTTWTSAADYKLGSITAPDSKIWGGNRTHLGGGDSIAPGESHTFVVSCTAPSTPGDYDFQYQMVQKLVEWFGGQSPLKTITVTSADPYDSWNPLPPGPKTGRGDDWDNDGYTNEYEYFFGMDPADSSNSSGNKKTASMGSYTHTDTKDYPSITFSYRNDGSVSNYYIDTTSNLSNWDLDQRGANFTDVEGSLTDNGDNTSTVTIRYNTDFSAIPEQKLFIRVRAVE